jgi:hypothetical protein
MVTANHLESYLVALLPFWPIGVGLAKSDLLEKTADEKNSQCGFAVDNLAFA